MKAKNFVLLVLFFTFSSQALAQKIKVRRVKGNQAVIEFSGGTIQPGQAYELVQDEFSEGDSSGGSQRRYLVNLNFAIENTKADSTGATNDTDIALAARFGWNLGTFELGPLVSYSSDATGSVTTTTMLFGGWADLNMIPNAPGEIFVYGVGGQAGFGQREGNGSSQSLMMFMVMPFVKWFPFGSDVGLRLDAGYVYSKQGSTSGDVTTTGFMTSGGLLGYF